MLTRQIASPLRRHGSTAAERGLSIVELLVGVAVGMFVLAGATMVVSNQMSDNKRLLLETQVQQDMRAAMDIIVRDIRRSGYTRYSQTRVQPVNAAPTSKSAFTPAGFNNFAASLGSSVAYTYADNPESLDNVVGLNDDRGFRLEGGRIEVLLGSAGYQALTDTNVVTITAFTVDQQVSAPMPLPTCSGPMPCTTLTCPPPNGQYVATRNLVLTMNGQAVHDPSIKRQIRASVRVRNDEVCL